MQGLHLAPPSLSPSAGMLVCGCQEENPELLRVRPRGPVPERTEQHSREVSRAPPGRAALPYGTREALTTALKPTLSPACPSAHTAGPRRSHLWPPQRWPPVNTFLFRPPPPRLNPLISSRETNKQVN